jgi:hypothetical protein
MINIGYLTQIFSGIYNVPGRYYRHGTDENISANKTGSMTYHFA